MMSALATGTGEGGAYAIPSSLGKGRAQENPEATSPDSSPSLSAGGIGEAVCCALVGEPGITVSRLAVGEVPRSGKPAELLKMFGIDRDAIAQAVRDLVAKA